MPINSSNNGAAEGAEYRVLAEDLPRKTPWDWEKSRA